MWTGTSPRRRGGSSATCTGSSRSSPRNWNARRASRPLPRAKARHPGDGPVAGRGASRGGPHGNWREEDSGPTRRRRMEMTDRHREYWQKNLRITGILLAIWFFVTFVVGYFARDLSFKFFGWPF